MKSKNYVLYAVLSILALVVVFLCVAYATGFWPYEAEQSEADVFSLMEPPVVYDYSGNVSSMAWLTSEFGPVEVTRTELDSRAAYVFRIVALRAQCDYATLKVDVYDENWTPIPNVSVIRYWPDAPILPDFSDTTASQWTTRGDVGYTDANGAVGFGMGLGDYYFVPDTGASKVYVADFAGPSDLMSGLGMLGATNHCHIDTVFQKISDTYTPPTPEPTDPPEECPECPVCPTCPDPVDCGSWEINITGTIEEK